MPWRPGRSGAFFVAAVEPHNVMHVGRGGDLDGLARRARWGSGLPPAFDGTWSCTNSLHVVLGYVYSCCSAHRTR